VVRAVSADANDQQGALIADNVAPIREDLETFMKKHGDKV